MEINVIIVCSINDFNKVLINRSLLQKYLSNNITIIANSKLKEDCLKNNMQFIDEDLIYPNLNYSKIQTLLQIKKADIKRTGWYFQQFLKMAYSQICTDEYYLIWDADTIPLKPINITNKPWFDTKTEYHKAYFDTIIKLFPDLYKKNNYSFISEHMIIKTSIMKEIINTINKNSNIIGNTWFEKIINSIDESQISKSGFSEFETYGTYVEFKYPELYDIKEFNSLRSNNDWCTPTIINLHLIKWLRKDFDAVSFDNWQVIDEKKSKILIRLSYIFDYKTSNIIYSKYNNKPAYIISIIKFLIKKLFFIK